MAVRRTLLDCLSITIISEVVTSQCPSRTCQCKSGTIAGKAVKHHRYRKCQILQLKFVRHLNKSYNRLEQKSLDNRVLNCWLLCNVTLAPLCVIKGTDICLHLTKDGEELLTDNVVTLIA